MRPLSQDSNAATSASIVSSPRTSLSLSDEEEGLRKGSGDGSRNGNAGSPVTRDDEEDDEDRPYAAIQKQLYVIALFPFGEAIAWTTIFPYVYAMVASMSPLGEEDPNIARYAGMLVSAFTLGESLSSMMWARVSDKIGRKPSLLIGNVMALTLAILFGLSGSLYWAIFWRFLGGWANPNITLVNTVIGELVPKKHQAKCFSTVTFYRVIGYDASCGDVNDTDLSSTILGPPLGGYLAEPVSKYPFLFKTGSIWDSHPYLLPNVFAAASLLTSAVLALFLMEESHPILKRRPDVLHRIKDFLVARYRGTADSAPRYEPLATDATELSTPPTPNTPKAVTDHNELATLDRSRAFTTQVRLQIASYSLLGYLKVTIMAMEPIYLGIPWLALPATNRLLHVLFGSASGFGLDTTSTSHLLLTQAVAAISSQWFLVAPVINRWGAREAYKIVLVVFVIVLTLCPMAPALGRVWGIVFITPVWWTYAAANTLGTTSQAVMLTNSAPDRSYLATINGANVLFGSMTRTIGPLVTGPLFKVALRHEYLAIPFYSMSLVCGVAYVVALWLHDYR